MTRARPAQKTDHEQGSDRARDAPVRLHVHPSYFSGRYVFPPRQPAKRMPEQARVRRNWRKWQPLVLPEPAQERGMNPSLSRREIEVLTHVARGETSKGIARSLGIRNGTANGDNG